MCGRQRIMFSRFMRTSNRKQRVFLDTDIFVHYAQLVTVFKFSTGLIWGRQSEFCKMTKSTENTVFLLTLKSFESRTKMISSDTHRFFPTSWSPKLLKGSDFRSPGPLRFSLMVHLCQNFEKAALPSEGSGRQRLENVITAVRVRVRGTIIVLLYSTTPTLFPVFLHIVLWRSYTPLKFTKKSKITRFCSVLSKSERKYVHFQRTPHIEKGFLYRTFVVN